MNRHTALAWYALALCLVLAPVVAKKGVTEEGDPDCDKATGWEALEMPEADETAMSVRQVSLEICATRRSSNGLRLRKVRAMGAVVPRAAVHLNSRYVHPTGSA
jgi:hypothetical protein